MQENMDQKSFRYRHILCNATQTSHDLSRNMLFFKKRDKNLFGRDVMVNTTCISGLNHGGIYSSFCIYSSIYLHGSKESDLGLFDGSKLTRTSGIGWKENYTSFVQLFRKVVSHHHRLEVI